MWFTACCPLHVTVLIQESSGIKGRSHVGGTLIEWLSDGACSLSNISIISYNVGKCTDENRALKGLGTTTLHSDWLVMELTTSFQIPDTSLNQILGRYLKPFSWGSADRYISTHTHIWEGKRNVATIHMILRIVASQNNLRI